MMNLSAACRFLICLAALFTWSGCDLFPHTTEDEDKNPHFLAGKSRVNSMDYAGAVEAFEKALQANPNSASAHFELGLLAEQRMNDYAGAIYHYQKHLKLRPKSNMAETVRQRISSCTVELAKSIPYSLVSQPVKAQLDRLIPENASLRQQVEQLKSQLAKQIVPQVNRDPAWTNQAPANPALVATNQTTPKAERASPPSAPPTSQPQPLAGPKTYAIKKGDTMKAIADRHGISLNALQSANPGVDSRRLRVGQSLKIPGPSR